MIDITRPESLEIESASALHGSAENKKDSVSYHLQKTNSVYSDTVLIAFGGVRSFSRIRMEADYNLKISVFASVDGENWSRVPIVHEMKQAHFVVWDFPLTEGSHLQLNISPGSGSLFSHFSAPRIEVQRNAELQVKASSQLDRLWTAENLFDGREDYGWSSAETSEPAIDFVEVSFNHPRYIRRIALKSVHEEVTCFPSSFSIELSLDGNVWQTVITESQFFASPGSIYFWDIENARANRVRLHVHEPFQKKKDSFCSRILDMKIFALPDSQARRGSGNQPLYASELMPGVVTFSEDRGTSRMKSVQSSDSRLKPASTTNEGIVLLAGEGESASGKVVQSHDPRLRPASEEYPGIIQLASHDEVRPMTAVQSTDPRLRRGTVDYPGIVQLADDSATLSGQAVQASDSRLKMATEKQSGIVILAENGGVLPGTVVQGNDARLRSASTAIPGIGRFAVHGESASLAAVQSDDPRLAEGTETSRGGVQFARSGEDSPLKAVQSSDERLKPATESSPGIVSLAANGDLAAGSVVQATDKRLTDARDPLPHDHAEYAKAGHSFAEHKGPLHMEAGEKTSDVKDWNSPDPQGFPLYVKNAEGAAALLRGGLVSRSGERTALTAVSKKGTAVEASSREGVGMQAFSAENYALTIPATWGAVRGSGRALHAEGISRFSGEVFAEKNGAIAVSFPGEIRDPVQEGDLLTLKESRLAQVRDKKEPVVGVFVKSAALVVGPEGKSLVGVSGLLPMRVRGPVQSGDKLCFKGADPGVASVCAADEKALAIAVSSSSENRETVVQVLLVK